MLDLPWDQDLGYRKKGLPTKWVGNPVIAYSVEVLHNWIKPSINLQQYLLACLARLFPYGQSYQR